MRPSFNSTPEDYAHSTPLRYGTAVSHTVVLHGQQNSEPFWVHD